MQKSKKKVGTSEQQDLRIAMWCQDEDEEMLTYIFQLQSKTLSILEQAAGFIQGTSAGSGFDQRKKERILLIKKHFFSQQEYKNFIRNFEYTIERVE